MTGRFQDRVAVVTGGTRGIGEAIVRGFAREGAVAAFCGRDTARGPAIVEELRAEGARAEYFECDVGEPAQIQAWIDSVVRNHGRIDVVVNNAATTTVGPLEETSLETWDRMMLINVTAMFLVCRATIPHLRASGGGTIINLGSTFGTVGVANSVIYGITKAAAISLSRGLAIELAPDKIRVVALCPGGTMTEFTQEWLDGTPDPEATLAGLVALHPLGRLSTPDEQAKAALWLASDEASFVTGSLMMVDGGFTAQ